MLSVHIDGIIFSLQRFGGISVYFRELAKHLMERNVDFSLTLEEPVLQNLQGDVPSKYLVERNARFLERIRRSRSTKRNTVFHSTYYRLPEPKKPAEVVTVYDFIAERYSKSLRSRAHGLQKRRALAQANSIICISEATRIDLHRFCDIRADQMVTVIPCGVSKEYGPLHTTTEYKPFVLYVGARKGYKNFRTAVAAMAHLNEIEMICVGGGPLLETELHGVGGSVRERIRHVGHIADRELNALYNSALCLLFPSQCEGFGIPVAEAMRAGCPVVSIPCDAVIETGGSCLELAEDDPYSIATAIEKLADHSYRKIKITEGILRAQRYDWSRSHDATLEVYHHLVNQ